MKRADVIDDLVWQRQQLGAERIDHLAVRDFELRDVHQLVALLSQFEQLQFARDALSHGAFGHEVDAVFAAVAGGDAAQVIDVRQSDHVHRRGTPVDLQFAQMPGNGGLVEAEMLGDLHLGWHAFMTPWSASLVQKARGSNYPHPPDFSGAPDKRE